MTVGKRITFIGVCVALVGVPLAIGWNIYDYALLPKRIAFHLAISLALIGYLTDLIFRRTTGPTGGVLQAVLVAFLGLSVLSAINSTHLLDSAVELAYLGTLMGLALCVSRFGIHDIERLTWATTLTGLAVSLIGIGQYLGYDPLALPTNGHPSATFGYRNFAAMYLVCALPLAAWTHLRSDRPLSVAVSALSGTLMLVFLAYTRTRGALLGLAIAALALVTVLVISRSSRQIFLRTAFSRISTFRRAIWAASALLLLGLGALGPRFTDTGLQRFDEKKSDLAVTIASIASDAGDRGRLGMWENTLDLIWDNPLLGVGPGGWYRAYPEYDRGEMIRPNSSPKRPHNDYLWIAAENGIPAALLYVGALFLACIAFYRMSGTPNSSWSLAGPFAGMSLIAISVHGFFSFPREQTQAAMLVFLLFGIAAFTHRESRKPIRRSTALITVGMALLAGLAGSLLSIRFTAFDAHYLSALQLEDRDDWASVLAETEAGLEYGVFRTHMLVVQGRALERQQKYEEAAKAYEKALELFPNSWHALNGAGVVYKRLGRNDDALVAYRAALRIFPTSAVVRNNLGALHRALGDTEAAETEYRLVLESAPDDPGANNNMGNIFKSRGELDSARVSYERALSSTPDLVQAHNNLGDLLRIQKQPARALEHYQTAVGLAPGEPMIHWGMGLTYEDLGDPISAELAYRRAIEARPDFPRAYFSLGELLFGLKRYEESGHSFKQFLAWWPQKDDEFARFAKQRIRTNATYLERSRKSSKKQ